MRGFTPNRARVVAARAAGISFALILGACAHAAPPVVVHADDAELARLRAELAQRDQTIAQLEGRLALAEAGQRQLRQDLLSKEVGAARETVRIGRPPAPEPARQIEEPVELARPMLRLHNERAPRSYGAGGEYTSTWTAPVANERLSVVPVPDAPYARRVAPPAVVSPPQVAPPQVAPPPPVAPPPQLTPSSSATAPVEPSQADDLYVRALDLLRRREFAEAQRELDAFVLAQPRDPRAGKAHFFRAELRYAERDYARALAAYEQSLRSDPEGDKAPDAMLRSALCQLALGAREAARNTLNSLRAKFPDSAAAKKAVQVMQEDSG